jgi:hypothetical protein
MLRNPLLANALLNIRIYLPDGASANRKLVKSEAALPQLLATFVDTRQSNSINQRNHTDTRLLLVPFSNCGLWFCSLYFQVAKTIMTTTNSTVQVSEREAIGKHGTTHNIYMIT